MYIIVTKYVHMYIIYKIYIILNPNLYTHIYIYIFIYTYIYHIFSGRLYISRVFHPRHHTSLWLWLICGFEVDYQSNIAI